MKNTLIALLTIVLLAVSSVAFAAEFSLGDIGAISLLDVTTLIAYSTVSVKVAGGAEIKEIIIVLDDAKKDDTVTVGMVAAEKNLPTISKRLKRLKVWTSLTGILLKIGSFFKDWLG